MSTNTFDYSVGQPSDAEVTADSARRRKARRAAERGSAALLEALRREHPGRDHCDAADAHRFKCASHAQPANHSKLTRFIKGGSNERIAQ